MLVSAALFIPPIWLGLFCEPEYWTPRRVVNLPIGIEDFLFCFAAGGLVWVAATALPHRRVITRIRPQVFVKRYVMCVLVSVSLAMLLILVGVNSMVSYMVVALPVAAFILILSPSLWPLAIAGPLFLTVPYLLFVAGLFRFSPLYIQQWTAENLWGIYVLGVPLEEVVWMASLAVLTPLLVGYAMDVKIQRLKPGSGCDV